MYPNLIIAGAAKSGSTTIFDLLKNHSQICMSNVKEPNIFLRDWGKEKDYYKKYFPHYAKEPWIGEATVAYFIEEYVPKRIFDVNPGMKFIFTFRDPVYQFFSNYWHRVRKGHEYRSWQEALRGDLEGDLYACGYYYSNLQYYLKYFPVQNMHFVVFEELIQNMDQEYKKILNFLSLPMENRTQALPWSNKGYVFKSTTVGFTINRIRATKKIYNLIPRFVRPAGKAFLKQIEKINKSPMGKNEFKESDKNLLKQIYKAEIEELSLLLKRKLPW